MGGTSRISRETYVRICERLGVRFPGSTRRPHVCSWHSTTLPKIGRPILSNPIRWRPARRPRTEARPRRTDVSRVKKGIDKPRPVTEADVSSNGLVAFMMSKLKTDPAPDDRPDAWLGRT